MLWGQALDQIRAHIEALERSLAEADALIAAHAYKIDPTPQENWPRGSVLGMAVLRHTHRLVDETMHKAERRSISEERG